MKVYLFTRSNYDEYEILGCYASEKVCKKLAREKTKTQKLYEKEEKGLEDKLHAQLKSGVPYESIRDECYEKRAELYDKYPGHSCYDYWACREMEVIE